MKIHLVTVGKPKLPYAVHGWEDYSGRLARIHDVRTSHLADKYADYVQKFTEITRGTYTVALEIEGMQMNSHELAAFLDKRAVEAREVSFVIGGPNGLPEAVRAQADFHWSLSRLTLPHDLAMVVMTEALFRASTINIHLPYHR